MTGFGTKTGWSSNLPQVGKVDPDLEAAINRVIATPAADNNQYQVAVPTFDHWWNFAGATLPTIANVRNAAYPITTHAAGGGIVVGADYVQFDGPGGWDWRTPAGLFTTARSFTVVSWIEAVTSSVGRIWRIGNKDAAGGAADSQIDYRDSAGKLDCRVSNGTSIDFVGSTGVTIPLAKTLSIVRYLFRDRDQTCEVQHRHTSDGVTWYEAVNYLTRRLTGNAAHTLNNCGLFYGGVKLKWSQLGLIYQELDDACDQVIWNAGSGVTY